MPSLQWTTIAIDDVRILSVITRVELIGVQYLVEVKRSENRPIPDNWILHSKYVPLPYYAPQPASYSSFKERGRWHDIIHQQLGQNWMKGPSIAKCWRFVSF